MKAPQAPQAPPAGAGAGAVSDEEYRALAQFRRALRSFLQFSEQAARAMGLNPAQYQLLLAIRGSGPGDPTIGDMAAWLGLRHHSAVELVDRAEAAGLLRREGDPADRRLQRLILTQQGSEKLDALAAVHREELRRFRDEGLSHLLTL